jgi:acetoacetate decarboxylase
MAYLLFEVVNSSGFDTRHDIFEYIQIIRQERAIIKFSGMIVQGKNNFVELSKDQLNQIIKSSTWSVQAALFLQSHHCGGRASLPLLMLSSSNSPLE